MHALSRHASVAPHPLRRAVTELHVVGCDCAECDTVPALTVRQTIGVAAAGCLTATAIAAVIDPAGTVAIVVDLFRWWLW